MARQHLYRGKGSEEAKKEIERRYQGERNGKDAYGAIVGKVYREKHGGKNWNTGKTYHEHGKGRTGRIARRRRR